MPRHRKRAALQGTPVIPIDRKSPLALHRQIYDSFRDGDRRRNLHRGQRIPPPGVLASELGVSRFPVLGSMPRSFWPKATSRVESELALSFPTRFRINSPWRWPALNAAAHAASWSPPSGSPLLRPPSSYRDRPPPWFSAGGAFGVGFAVSTIFPLHIWSNLVARHCRNANAVSGHYGEAIGSQALREAIVNDAKPALSPL